MKKFIILTPIAFGFLACLGLWVASYIVYKDNGYAAAEDILVGAAIATGIAALLFTLFALVVCDASDFE